MRAIRALLAVSFVTSLGMYTSEEAHANGRFPKAQAIATVPGQAGGNGAGATVFLRATFGVLASHDGGKHFQWLCEQALGFSSTWDPPIAVTKDARLWVALEDGLRVTRDGCDVQDIPSLKGEVVADLATDATGDRVYAITATPDKRAFVYASRGDAFERLGAGVTGTRFDTIEVAPSKKNRLYFTGVPEGAGARAHFFRSDDGGVTLRETSPKLAADGRLFVSAVDPKDADRVYVRLLNDKGSDVLLSTDGGATFRSVLHMAGAMFGFARADDGTLYAGSGDPKEGIWRSRDRGEHWEQAAHASVFCLHASGARLFACSNPYVPKGYAIAVSTDQGASITPLATFDDVTGPVACDAGSGVKCAAPWPETRSMIATKTQMQEEGPAIDALPADAAVLADASHAAPSPSAPMPASRSCACRASGLDDARSNAGVRPLGLALVIAFALRARRRFSGSESPQRDL